MDSWISILEQFNSRELAFFVWIFLLGIWALNHKSIRESVNNVFKTFFNRTMLTITTSMIFYICFIVLLLKYIGYWDYGLLKDTIFWIIGVSFIQLFNLNKPEYENGFFIKIFKDNLKFIIIFEFLVNLFTFNFWTELILLPLYTAIVAVYTVSDLDEKYNPAKKLTENILVGVGFVIILFISIKTFQEFSIIFTLDNFRNIGLPILLTIGYLPFLYFMALFMSYESLFVRISVFLKENEDISRVAKERIILKFNLNLKKLNQFKKTFLLELFKLDDKTKIVKIINDYKY
ncbi:MAG: hypothetical protein H8E98_04265 [Bacteroidetes bacterium]|nr:hypothetical protein [Bacteroidota bacterium]